MSAGPAYTAEASVQTPWIDQLDSSTGSWELVEQAEGETQAEAGGLPALPARELVTALILKERNLVPCLEISADLEGQLLAATGLSELNAFRFYRFSDLYRDPEFNGSSTSAEIRIARAVRAGVSAGRKSRGAISAVVPSPSLFDKAVIRWYICLTCRQFKQGFLTQSYRRYWAETKLVGGQRFDPKGVHHSFGTLSEVVAYLAGAERGWPLELH